MATRRYHKVGVLKIRCLFKPEDGIRKAGPTPTVRWMRGAEV
jgi:hypothetical protein